MKRSDVGIGRERRDRPPDEARRLGLREVLVLARSPSRQVASVTPKWSSIASERRKPGRDRDRRDAVRAEVDGEVVRDAPVDVFARS